MSNGPGMSTDSLGSHPLQGLLVSRRARDHAEEEAGPRQRTGTHTKPALNGRTRDTQTQTTQIAQRIGAFRDEGPGEATSVPEALADSGSTRTRPKEGKRY